MSCPYLVPMVYFSGIKCLFQSTFCGNGGRSGGGPPTAGRSERPVQPESQPKWPIVARDDEFRRALAALDGTTDCHGVALVGDSGVGKSTLAPPPPPPSPAPWRRGR